MPFGDRTGPRGMGPMTGRAAGYCAGFGQPGFANPITGRGFGLRRGMGFGFRGSSPPWPYVGLGRGGLPRCGYFFSGAAGVPTWSYQPPYPVYTGATPTPGSAPQMTKELELDSLKSQAQAIKGQLKQIESRIQELEKE